MQNLAEVKDATGIEVVDDAANELLAEDQVVPGPEQVLVHRQRISSGIIVAPESSIEGHRYIVVNVGSEVSWFAKGDEVIFRTRTHRKDKSVIYIPPEHWPLREASEYAILDAKSVVGVIRRKNQGSENA